MLTTTERFWRKVQKTETCWPWLAAKLKAGYGCFWDSKRMTLAHRFSYELHNGQIPKNMQVLHHCDNPNCVNPAHLFLGTQADNVADCRAKGHLATGDRHGSHTHPESRTRGDNHWTHCHPERLLMGERNPQAKLTRSQIEEIRHLYDSKKVLGKDLAHIFGVSRAHISNIAHRKRWRD